MKQNNSAPAHLRYQTKFSREGVLDMSNKKPYRTKALKREAREKAVKTKDGHYFCPRVPTRTHPPVKG